MGKKTNVQWYRNECTWKCCHDLNEQLLSDDGTHSDIIFLVSFGLLYLISFSRRVQLKQMLKDFPLMIAFVCTALAMRKVNKRPRTNEQAMRDRERLNVLIANFVRCIHFTSYSPCLIYLLSLRILCCISRALFRQCILFIDYIINELTEH